MKILSQFQIHLLYMKGWGDGAGFRAMHINLPEEEGWYVAGYTAGQKTRRATALKNAKKLGVTLNTIKSL